jgi:hypothetical protein
MWTEAQHLHFFLPAVNISLLVPDSLLCSLLLHASSFYSSLVFKTPPYVKVPKALIISTEEMKLVFSIAVLRTYFS